MRYIITVYNIHSSQVEKKVRVRTERSKGRVKPAQPYVLQYSEGEGEVKVEGRVKHSIVVCSTV